MKKQKENSHERITWSEMGKQNVQAEKVYKTIKWTLLLNKHNVSFIDIMTDLLLIVMNKEPFKF